uniref:4Fe-4S ferredoxin-type domain-containing protein n=1 Tax=Oryza meridionalis TaxID=40149 RepID=A0A0E0E1X6_9ORYZ
MHVELVDLTTEGDGVEDQNIPSKDDAILCTTLHSPNFVAAHGQGDTAYRIVTLCKQGFIAVVDAEEAMQSGNRELSAANDGKGEAKQSADQGIVVAGDCTEEVLMSGNQDFASAVADAEETMQSGTQEFVAEGDHSRDAMQFGNAGQASTCSSMSEQGAITYSSMTEQIATASSSMTGQWSREAAAFLCSRPMSIASPFPRQFWKAGEYSVAAQPTINSDQNHLRIHPKFLHSNATSHKWAFGAIAELLDNAVDEVNNGATFVKIDKIKCSLIDEYSLVIQDDGGGMSPESLRHCMSFGFSKKSGNSSIGQYGNGFKTSSMRLGADVIVFSCTQDNRRLTRSIGILSYTFLTKTGCNDILVPVVDYEFDESSHTLKKIMDHGEKHFSSNLSTLLKWSPFTTEDDLLNQFGDMGCHGTKLIVFNLWFNDAWEMELDFASDEEDIMISGAPAMPDGKKTVGRLNHMHVANRFRYSLRVYASILYLQLPKHFKVILCGRVVEPHHIVNDLIYCECIKYRPQVGINIEVDVITTIGYLRGAPKLDIHGFNVYHKNRLILPFWCAHPDKSHSKGISGVLEANFIRPTHDKQDFEKTGLFHRLETRLKEMTLEYWKHHAHLVGYARVTKALPPAHYASTVARDDSLAAQASTVAYDDNSRARESVLFDMSSNGESSKRRNSCSVIHWRAQKRQHINDYANQPPDVNAVQMKDERIRHLICQKKVLKDECSKLEASEQQLLCKELKEKMLGSGMPWPGDEGDQRWEQAWMAIKKVWASKWNERAYFSTRKVKLDHDYLSMTVLVQEIVNADYAFVIYTTNPSSGDSSEIYAEVVKGLGETLGHDYTLLLNEAYKVLMRNSPRNAGASGRGFGRGFTGNGYSCWNGPVRSHALFVDENKCIGCRECVHHAGETFAMDDVLGSAHVEVQFGDQEQKIQVAVESCPVNCIHWVMSEELAVLEFLARPQQKEAHGVFGGGWERPRDVFAAANNFTKRLQREEQ